MTDYVTVHGIKARDFTIPLRVVSGSTVQSTVTYDVDWVELTELMVDHNGEQLVFEETQSVYPREIKGLRVRDFTIPLKVIHD